MSERPTTQEQIAAWKQVLDFLGTLYVKAMQADAAAGTELPRELSDALIAVAEAFDHALKVVKRYA